MRLIWEVHYLLSQNPPNKVDLSEFKVDFGEAGDKERQVPGRTPEEKMAVATASSKARWGSFLAGGGFKFDTNSRKNRQRKANTRKS